MRRASHQPNFLAFHFRLLVQRMSWQATAATKRLVRDAHGRPLRMAQKLLLFIIADSVDPRTSIADLSQKLLAQQALCSMRTVQRLLTNLEQRGLLEIHGSADRRGHRYRLTYAAPEDPKKGDNLTPFQGEEGRQFDALPPTGRATNGSGKGDKRKREGRQAAVAPSSRSSKEEKSRGGSNPEPPRFAFLGTHLKVTTSQQQILGEAFPWVELEPEYRKMDAWLDAHPRRRPRVQAAFIHNWIAKIESPGVAGQSAREARVGRLHPWNEPPRCVACDVTAVRRAGDCCSPCQEQARRLLGEKGEDTRQ